MENSLFINKFVPMIIGVSLLIFSSFVEAAVRLSVAEIYVESVTLSGPGKIAKGNTSDYTITYRLRRVLGGKLDPRQDDIIIIVTLWDKDGWFRWSDDALSEANVTIPAGAINTSFSMITTLQLQCTKKKKIRGVGYIQGSNGKSGEKKAEVYAEVNGIITRVKKVKCR